MQALNTYIVEDNPLIRDSLIATLEEMVPVRVVGSSPDEHTAVGWLEGHAADLVIIDLFLKGGSGLGVLRAAHAMGLPHRLVVFSNFATEDMRRTCISLGADRVFDKSHDIDDLIAYCTDLAAARHVCAGSAGPPPQGTPSG